MASFELRTTTIERAVLLLLSLAAVAACARPGIAPGNSQRGFVVWGFLGQGTTTAATGQQATLVNAYGQPVQSVISDSMGKYVFAYHQPGNYTITVGTLKMPVAITTTDQRLDIDLSKASGKMDYLAGAVENASPPACSNAAPAPSAAGPGQAQAEERDPNLAGAWGRTDSLSSGDASLSTKLSLLICRDGKFTRTVGDSAGGGAGWSAESSGSESTRGRWRTQAGVIYTNSGAGWEAYARYYVEGAKLMLTFSGGQREIWYR